MTNSCSAATTTAVTVVDCVSASDFAASHNSVGMRIARIGVRPDMSRLPRAENGLELDVAPECGLVRLLRLYVAAFFVWCQNVYVALNEFKAEREGQPVFGGEVLAVFAGAIKDCGGFVGRGFGEVLTGSGCGEHVGSFPSGCIYSLTQCIYAGQLEQAVAV